MNNDLIELLSSRLHQPLPGLTAQRTMEPELGYGRYGGPALPDARPASVVALLHLINGQWHLPLILRPESLTHHAGQISLPGGIIEQGETSEEAALRELEEELGIPRFDTLLLGQLSPLFLYGTNFLITPWIAALGGTRVFQPSAAEVEEILKVPLAHLIDQRSRGQHVEQRGSLQFKVPHFDWRGHQIWGATSMILAELMAVMNEIAA